MTVSPTAREGHRLRSGSRVITARQHWAFDIIATCTEPDYFADIPSPSLLIHLLKVEWAFDIMATCAGPDPDWVVKSADIHPTSTPHPLHIHWGPGRGRARGKGGEGGEQQNGTSTAAAAADPTVHAGKHELVVLLELSSGPGNAGPHEARAPIAVGETVIPLHPPVTFSRCFNREKMGVPSK